MNLHNIRCAGSCNAETLHDKSICTVCHTPQPYLKTRSPLSIGLQRQHAMRPKPPIRYRRVPAWAKS